jgi:hypothetical protein
LAQALIPVNLPGHSLIDTGAGGDPRESTNASIIVAEGEQQFFEVPLSEQGN